MYAKNEKTYLAYVSKQKSKREKQVVLFMISNGKGSHYLVVKKLPALLKRIASKYDSNFYCLNCLHSFRIKKTKLESHKNVCETFAVLRWLLKKLK